MRRLLVVVALALVPIPVIAQPLVDHHQHLISPTLAKAGGLPPITAADLIKHLDDAGIRRAVVLSTAYIHSSPERKLENDYEFVRVDNDWTAEQVALYPDRLIGFCGVNPLKNWAVTEIVRCANNPRMARGLKLHFGNSEVDYHNPRHIESVKAVFAAANQHGMAIVVHMRANTERKMGRDEAMIFLNELLPAAPNVIVQIAHMGGAGRVEPSIFNDGLDVFIKATLNGDPRMKNVWFDISMGPNLSAEDASLFVRRMRELGIDRMLFGSDAPVPGNLPRQTVAAFRKLPLTDAEFRTIEKNVAPYLR